MQKVIFVLVLLINYRFLAAQITIVRSDLPVPNDIYKVRVTNQPFGINLNQSGPSQNWNYSNLISFIEREDTFYSPWQTPPVYWLFFNGFNTSLAQKLPNNLSIGPFLTISEIYNFYYANTSRYELTGFGALINNIPTPVKHDTADVIYRFPISYGNKDTSFSTFDVNIPGIGYWKNNQRRYNHVDSWGTLQIPNGTFDVLRIKSEIYNSDSIHLDTLGGFGGRFPRPKQTEYKFLAKNSGIPVLTILTQTNQFGMENITSIEYLALETVHADFVKSLNSEQVVIFPQPAQNQVWIKVYEPNQLFHLQLHDLNGKLIFEDVFISNAPHELKNLPSGFYFLSIFNEKYYHNQKIWIKED